MESGQTPEEQGRVQHNRTAAPAYITGAQTFHSRPPPAPLPVNAASGRYYHSPDQNQRYVFQEEEWRYSTQQPLQQNTYSRPFGSSVEAIRWGPPQSQPLAVAEAPSAVLQQFQKLDLPPGSIAAPSHIGRSAQTSPRETLDPSYKRRKDPANFFVIGKVFMTLWPQLAGDTCSDNSTGSAVSTENRFGEAVWTKVRRFVVVRPSDRYCNVVSILTYSGQGVAKRGVSKAEHSIIYTGKQAPEPGLSEVPTASERGLLKPAIRVDSDLRYEKLDQSSRLDFGRVYTVEHNIKVRSFGKVNRDSLAALMAHFSTVLAPPTKRLVASNTKGTQEDLPASARAKAKRLTDAQKDDKIPNRRWDEDEDDSDDSDEAEAA